MGFILKSINTNDTKKRFETNELYDFERSVKLWNEISNCSMIGFEDWLQGLNDLSSNTIFVLNVYIYPLI